MARKNGKLKQQYNDFQDIDYNYGGYGNGPVAEQFSPYDGGVYAESISQRGGVGDYVPLSELEKSANPSGTGGMGGGALSGKKGILGNLFAPELMGNLKGTFGSIASPQFNWNKQTGVQGWGKNLGSYATLGNALYQGYNAAQGLEDLSDSSADTEELVNDLVNASYNNSMLAYDLNSDQKKLLRELRSGNYDTDVDFNDIRPMDILGGAAKGGISGFLYGGIPGAVVGALGSGANSAVDSLNRAQSGKMDELDALYQSILQSEDQQNALKKQRMYAAMGY